MLAEQNNSAFISDTLDTCLAVFSSEIDSGIDSVVVGAVVKQGVSCGNDSKPLKSSFFFRSLANFATLCNYGEKSENLIIGTLY